MTDNDINALIAIRERATNRIDEQIDWNAVDPIDAQLAQVPPGQRNDVDLLLGRPDAVLPERAIYSPKKSTVFDPKWSDRTIYLTTTVDNGYEPDALIEHATPDNIDEARQWAAHNLDWFGKQQGFKTTCRISIDNLFEEITIFDPAVMRPPTDTAAATEAVAELAQAKQDEHDAYLESIMDQFSDWLDFERILGDLAI